MSSTEQTRVSSSSSSSSSSFSSSSSPASILMVGMAGSGKTTLVQRIHTHLRMQAMGSTSSLLSPIIPLNSTATVSNVNSNKNNDDDNGTTTPTTTLPPVSLLLNQQNSNNDALSSSSSSSSSASASNVAPSLPSAPAKDKLSSFIVNLDPAVLHLPYGPNIDIRDTVNYKEVMKQYNLGPNGAIITSLNLFATRFDQVTTLLKGKMGICENFILDTPGQIEVFMWSASGQLITDMLASVMPTIILFVVDTPRCKNPSTFMANMLYACSILYKTRLPLVVALNKSDVVPHDFILEWMEDFEAFQTALDEESKNTDSYAHSLTRSMSLVLDEFYTNLRAVGVSAATGEGMDELMEAIQDAVQEFDEITALEHQAAQQAKEEQTLQQQEQDIDRFRQDFQQINLRSKNTESADDEQ